jgi:hypothetical protein
MEATHSGLTSLGWHTDDPAVRDVVPAISRGNNLVVVTPPAPAYAAAVLAGIVERRSARQAIFVIAPAPGLEEWESLVAALATDLVPGPLLALGSRQAERRFRSGEGASLTIASPATAVALRQHSLIQPETIGAVVIAWPELWEDPGALTIALQEIPKEAQRVILTSDPGAIAAVIERHAWRAMTVGYSAPAAPSATPVQTVSVPWAQRVRVIAAVSERLGAASLAVWTADTSRHGELERVMAGIGVTGSRVTTGQPEAAAQVIAFDPPPAERLAQLAEAGSVTLLMPPGTERWIERLSSARKPLVISATLDSTDLELSRRRSLIDQAVGEGPLDEGLLALGPLFDRHDPASVAAALYQMWTRLPKPALTRQMEEGAAAGPRTRIWLGAGKRDEIGVSDVVGLLINEVRMDRTAIGRIELRDTFTLVEVPAPEAERIAQSLSGKTLRRRRLVARVDRKASH